jgi:hypothetical protein
VLFLTAKFSTIYAKSAKLCVEGAGWQRPDEKSLRILGNL